MGSGRIGDAHCVCQRRQSLTGAVSHTTERILDSPGRWGKSLALVAATADREPAARFAGWRPRLVTRTLDDSGARGVGTQQRFQSGSGERRSYRLIVFPGSIAADRFVVRPFPGAPLLESESDRRSERGG